MDLKIELRFVLAELEDRTLVGAAATRGDMRLTAGVIAMRTNSALALGLVMM